MSEIITVYQLVVDGLELKAVLEVVKQPVDVIKCPVAVERRVT